MNADLMLNNIYMSGEFAAIDDERDKPQTQKKEQDEAIARPPLLKGRLDSKSSFGLGEAEARLESQADDGEAIDVSR